MRVGYIYGDDGGMGHVSLTKDFEADSALYRADVLKDVLFDVWMLYSAARLELGWQPLTSVSLEHLLEAYDEGV